VRPSEKQPRVYTSTRGSQLPCPLCGKKTQVLDSRIYLPGERRRRMICEENHRFSTLEIYEDAMAQLRKDSADLKRLRALLSR